MSKKIVFDAKNDHIVRELVRDPRISDAKIAQKAGIPVATVQKRRVAMEKKGVVSYCTKVNHYADEKGEKGAGGVVLIYLAKGISKLRFLEAYERMQRDRSTWFSKHVAAGCFGEYDGQVTWILMLESRRPQDIVEILNADVYPLLRDYLGDGALDHWKHIPLWGELRMLHNYSLFSKDLELTKPKVSDSVFVK